MLFRKAENRTIHNYDLEETAADERHISALFQEAFAAVH